MDFPQQNRLGSDKFQKSQNLAPDFPSFEYFIYDVRLTNDIHHFCCMENSSQSEIEKKRKEFEAFSLSSNSHERNE